ncbi:MAG: FAD-dependent oxidoreductase [Dehalococcoidales bacterium]|nr:FAD-dependent oxidoreductase [Dehalococcoidales bacterium]
MTYSQVPKKWDGEADVIVVGGGNTGIPAAITAHDKGTKVIVLEASNGMASSLAMIAGGTPFTGTDLQKAEGIEDSPDKLYEEAVKVSGGDPELWRALADRQEEVYEWLKSLGAKPEKVLLAPGHKVRRSIKFEGHGPALCNILRNALKKSGIDVRYKHRARKLIVDNGRVIGITAESGDKTNSFKARKAVILATGGFCQNLDIVKEFGPQYADLVPTAPKTHQGDGLKMAMAIGAGTDGLGLAVCPSMPVGAETLQFVNAGIQGGITVDRYGKRFGNEATEELGTYTEKHKICLDHDPTGLHITVSDQAIKDLNEPPSTTTREPIYRVDTIEELEKQLGIPAGNLKATVDEYNSDIKKYGYDRKFGRRLQGMYWPDLPVMKLDHPPFYAVKNKICLTSMKGGLKINAKCQIIDQFGDVIPGLYAAGEIAGGLERIPHHYYTGRMTMQAFTQGRIAGDVAADEPGS